MSDGTLAAAEPGVNMPSIPETARDQAIAVLCDMAEEDRTVLVYLLAELSRRFLAFDLVAPIVLGPWVTTDDAAIRYLASLGGEGPTPGATIELDAVGGVWRVRAGLLHNAQLGFGAYGTLDDAQRAADHYARAAGWTLA